MNKFNVGDKVEVLDGAVGHARHFTGHVGVVAAGPLHPSDLELVYTVSIGGDIVLLYEREMKMAGETKKQHKHHVLIKAWADGEAIQWRSSVSNAWYDILNPSWDDEHEYRIKPTPKPDYVRYLQIEKEYVAQHLAYDGEKYKYDNVKATFDGETGELKAVEKL